MTFLKTPSTKPKKQTHYLRQICQDCGQVEVRDLEEHKNLDDYLTIYRLRFEAKHRECSEIKKWVGGYEKEKLWKK